jgi:uncharacterized protein YraI
MEVRESEFVLSRDDGWISELAGDSVVWYMQRYLAAPAKGRQKERERIGSTKESCGLMSFKNETKRKDSNARSGQLSVLSRGYREQHLMP